MVCNKLSTLIFVRESTRILLGYKKRGFGEGRWNGFGGKVEAGETILEGAKRELLEESGLTAHSMKAVGLLLFEFVGNPQLLEVHVFTTDKFSGTPRECDEMRPQWYKIEDIPFDKMWTDDKYWFPHLLKDQTFYGYFTFLDMVNIKSYTLHQVEKLSDIEIPQKPLSETQD